MAMLTNVARSNARSEPSREAKKRTTFANGLRSQARDSTAETAYTKVHPGLSISPSSGAKMADVTTGTKGERMSSVAISRMIHHRCSLGVCHANSAMNMM
jgi:hypothetical protein